ncbi:hypothetical protein FRX31_006287 [Thalictrum thalictroides]|uniref:DUF4283 domain-containing protein n=1 Tax=Thalictrum thalictroides TaxID=46969 RepID=A0A7J6X2Y4_THATH|nr:hypothetical protein FRX31_006287 [Thalictrum thalictroides]
MARKTHFQGANLNFSNGSITKFQTKKIESWSSLLKSPPPSAGSQELCFIEPSFKEGVLQLDEELIKEGAAEWEHKVVSFFLDKKLPFTMVKSVVLKRWNLDGEVEIALDGDMFYFIFNSEQDRVNVIEEGSFFIAEALEQEDGARDDEKEQREVELGTNNTQQVQVIEHKEPSNDKDNGRPGSEKREENSSSEEEELDREEEEGELDREEDEDDIEDEDEDFDSEKEEEGDLENEEKDFDSEEE